MVQCPLGTFIFVHLYIEVVMQDALDLFIRSTYSEGAQDDIYQTFGLFRVFNHLQPFIDIDDIIMMESFTTPEAMQDGITNRIIEGQDYLLDRHGIKLSDDATLAFRGIVLRGLLMIQKLEDATPYLRILESMQSDPETLARIMELLTQIPQTTFLQVLEEVRPICLTMMRQFLYSQEASDETVAAVINTTVQTYTRLFKDVFGINVAVRVVLESDAIAGEEFSVYLNLFRELQALITDEQMLVELLLFLILYSSDGVADPMAVYNEHAVQLVPDITIASRLGRTIAEMYTKLQRHQEKLNNEKA